jgi:hypothetical protein
LVPNVRTSWQEAAVTLYRKYLSRTNFFGLPPILMSQDRRLQAYIKDGSIRVANATKEVAPEMPR